MELATRDKQIEKLVDEKIKAKLTNQLRLADEDIDIPIGTTYALKVCKTEVAFDPPVTTDLKAGDSWTLSDQTV